LSPGKTAPWICRLNSQGQVQLQKKSAVGAGQVDALVAQQLARIAQEEFDPGVGLYLREIGIEGGVLIRMPGHAG